MHIPDGYISPQTSLVFWAGMMPIWTVALNKIKSILNRKTIPSIALGAAFSFVIMMFNIPMGASSVHATGAVLLSILLGPWSAMIGISIALCIQALLFGDGGVWALAANCFNMAFAMPFAGYFVYKWINGNCEFGKKRNMIAIFAAGFVGMNVAAFLTAFEFGIQPYLFKDSAGLPLYGYFPLSVSLPVIMFEHLLVAGPIEGILSVLVIKNLRKLSPELLAAADSSKSKPTSRLKLAMIFVPLLLLTPIGLLASGTAWGEWSQEELKNMIGFVPSGMEKLSSTWNALLPDYSIDALNGSFVMSSIVYVASGLIGLLVIGALMFFANRLTKMHKVENTLENKNGNCL